MATMSRARSRPPVPARPGALERPAPGRSGADRPFPFALHHPALHPAHHWSRARVRVCAHTPHLLHAPAPRIRVWIAVLGAAFSVLLAGLMTGAAMLCAEGVCHGPTDPAPARAELDLVEQPGFDAPVTPGRLPTADPAR